MSAAGKGRLQGYDLRSTDCLEPHALSSYHRQYFRLGKQEVTGVDTFHMASKE